MNEEILKRMMEFYSDPDYQKGFMDFFVKMQQEGVEAARKFWVQSAAKGKMNPQATEIFEQMIYKANTARAEAGTALWITDRRTWIGPAGNSRKLV